MAETDVIGKTYEPVKYEVGLEKIKEYAFATNDDNPLYTDEEAAKAGP
ncbi:MAG: MaoC family dehydratase N-terminal domain-containing protein, partial [Deltaproteobacteria bacterium]|nr:MaoC family dehydratase N-terminal domain-containing protein [Deltaproteobacteria bacterium]